MIPIRPEDRGSTRWCTTCKVYKPYGDFSKCNKSKDGLHYSCKKCKNEYEVKRRDKKRLEHNRRSRERWKCGYGEVLSDRNNRLKRDDPYLYRAKLLRHGVSGRAIKLGIDFDSEYFTEEKFEEMLLSAPICPCCGKKINHMFFGKVRDDRLGDRPTVDRLDNSKGYLRGNVNIICWRCNNLKNNASLSEIENIASWMKSELEKVDGNEEV